MFEILNNSGSIVTATSNIMQMYGQKYSGGAVNDRIYGVLFINAF
jgi:DNA-binding transcriptional regulator GbsR (MarR family)